MRFFLLVLLIATPCFSAPTEQGEVTSENTSEKDANKCDLEIVDNNFVIMHASCLLKRLERIEDQEQNKKIKETGSDEPESETQNENDYPEIEDYQIHPEFNSETGDNDVAVVIFKTPVPARELDPETTEKLLEMAEKWEDMLEEFHDSSDDEFEDPNEELDEDDDMEHEFHDASE